MLRACSDYSVMRLIGGVAFSMLFAACMSARAQSLRAPNEYSVGESRKALEAELNLIHSKLRNFDSSIGARQSRGGDSDNDGPRVVNGVGTIGYPASGALLSGSDPRSARAWCTGTLIRPNKFLTAAHCIVKRPIPGDYLVFLQSAGFFKVSAIDWLSDEYVFPRADVALLSLSTAVPHIQPEEINHFSTTQIGTSGTIVGFGRTGGLNIDYGIKREGYVETGPCADEYAGIPLVCWSYGAETVGGLRRSNTCNADSGGPLFTTVSQAGRLRRVIAGVTSGGRQSDCLVGDSSFNADVHHYKKWIESVAAKADVPPLAVTGPLLDADRDISGANFELSSGRSDVSLSINVPAGVAKLMVAMNGDDNGKGRNDFDLYVSRGSAEFQAAECTEDGPGQFAFCSFDNPVVGPWRILLRAKRGQGLAQLVVTQVPRATP